MSCENLSFHICVTNKTSCTIEISWQFDGDFNVFRINQQGSCDCWKRVYWARETSCVIENLEENTCFTFEISALQLKDDQFVVLCSETFKASTAPIVTIKTFHRAVQKSQIKTVLEILSQRPDYINLGYITALSIAVNSNNFQLAKILLENGALPDKGILNLKRTPLHMAVFNRNTEMAELLLKSNANMNEKDKFGLDIGHIAVNNDDLKMIEFCLEKGIDVESRDINGFTLLLRSIIVNAKLEIIKLLLDNNSKTTVKDSSNLTVLYHVRLKNHEELFELLKNYKPKLKTNVKQKVSQTVQRIILSQMAIKYDATDDDNSDEDPYSKYI